MASKVLVKLPMVPFPQEKKPPIDLVNITERNEELSRMRQQSMNIDKVSQLEQNMKFLQEQHQITLIALHREVENLRQKNRDLQFQLVFSKGTPCVNSSPSSPEDSENGLAKLKGSPECVNVTPLQVELLEKELEDVKTSLQEAKTHNQYLSDIIEQQKKRGGIDPTVGGKEKVLTADVGIQVGGKLVLVHADEVAHLEGAKAMVKRSHKENISQKWEIATLKGPGTNSGGISRNGRPRDGNNSHNRASPTAAMQEQSSHKFPPLQTQSYWHRRLPSFDHNSVCHKNGRSRHDKQDTFAEVDNTVLPQLQNDSTKLDTVIYEPSSYRSRGYHSYYREGGNRKYRGQISQRERRDPDHHYNRREYRDRNCKDQREFVDSSEGSKDNGNSRRQ